MKAFLKKCAFWPAPDFLAFHSPRRLLRLPMPRKQKPRPLGIRSTDGEIRCPNSKEEKDDFLFSGQRQREWRETNQKSQLLKTILRGRLFPTDIIDSPLWSTSTLQRTFSIRYSQLRNLWSTSNAGNLHFLRKFEF